MFFLRLLLLIVVSLISLAFRSSAKPKNATPGEIKESDMPMAEEGQYVCMVHGGRWMQRPSVLLYINLNTEPIRSSSKSAK